MAKWYNRIKDQNFWVMIIIVVFAMMFLKGIVSSFISGLIKFEIPDVALDFLSSAIIASAAILFSWEIFKEKI
jgi:hypothetical protein